MIAGITVYWKKFRAKQRAGEKFSEKLLLNEDESMVFTPDESMVFTLHQIVEATQNFSRILGCAGSGKVFFGRLPDGKEIVVEMLSCNSIERFKEFFTEVDLLSRVHHKNLLCLLGYCFDKSQQPMLIHEYMSEGPLTDHLYGEKAGLSKLNWNSRLKIAIDVAEALQYLHVCCIPMIIHRDVKTSNILLDSDLNGKLVNFGLSMMTMDRKAPIEDTVKGTLGYADPVYISTGQFTQKSDVYGFGVVLLEIICGRKPLDHTLPEEEIDLLRWVKEYVAINETPGKMVKIIDKYMDGKYDMKSITMVAKLALRCVEHTPSCRPSMSEVVGELKEAFMYEKVKLKKVVVVKPTRIQE